MGQERNPTIESILRKPQRIEQGTSARGEKFDSIFDFFTNLLGIPGAPDSKSSQGGQLLGMLLPAGMAKRFGKNFRDLVPTRLNREGYEQVADVLDTLAAKYPKLIGHLENMEVTLPDAQKMLTTLGHHNFIKGEYRPIGRSNRITAQTMPQHFTEDIDSGLTAPLGNNIQLHPLLASNPDKTRSTLRHEMTHLAQDSAKGGYNMLTHELNEQLPYAINPREILARATQNRENVSYGDDVLREANRGLNDLSMTHQLQTVDPHSFSRLVDLLQTRLGVPLRGFLGNNFADVSRAIKNR